MTETANEKKNIFYIIVLILTLICLIVSATIAYLQFINSQKKDSTVLYTGTLEVDYIDGVYIKDPFLLPQKEVNYNTYDDVYRNQFKIRSSGTLDQNIKADLVISKNEFSENDLKYVIYNDKGNQLSEGFVPKDGKINLINNVFLKSKDTATYTLIIWLVDKDYNQRIDTENVITGSISVEAVQVKY